MLHKCNNRSFTLYKCFLHSDGNQGGGKLVFVVSQVLTYLLVSWLTWLDLTGPVAESRFREMAMWMLPWSFLEATPIDRRDRVSAHLALNYLIDEQLCFALNDLMSNCVLLKNMKELTLSLFSSILAAWMVALYFNNYHWKLIWRKKTFLPKTKTQNS